MKSSKAACVAKKLSWMGGRETTRGEDMAYCLLGLLDVNMPLLYGEGTERAFQRLQLEFIRQYDDESIFAFELSSDVGAKFPFGILARSPHDFRRCGTFATIKSRNDYHTARPPYSVTNRGLQFVSQAVRVGYHQEGPSYKLRRYADQKIQEQRQRGVRDIYVVGLNCRSTEGSYNIHGVSWNTDGRCLIALSEYDGDVAYRTIPTEHEKDYSKLFQAGQRVHKEFLVRLTNKDTEVVDESDESTSETGDGIDDD